jgi:dTDP-4-dehydrorhamnose reductase
MIRVLLTGVSGQVGGALQGPLGTVGSVLVADRNVIDLGRPVSIATALDRLSPDLIINPAAYTAVDQAENERDLAYRVNAEAPGIIARWAASRNVPMLHFSTDYVFDGSGDRPWREEDPTHPLSVYGASKLAGEMAIREAKGSHLVVRTSWVFGSKGKNFLTTITRLAQDRPELRIVADQIGAPTSARSLAHAVISIISDQHSHARGLDSDVIRRRFAEAKGLVHMASKGETSWHGFAKAIVEGLRARGRGLATARTTAIATKDFPTLAKRPSNSRFNLSRLEEICGVQMPSWREALDIELDAMTTEP